MAREDIIMLRRRELKRLHVIHKVLEGTITQTEAAELVLLTERQIRRIVKRIREEGDEGIRHKSLRGFNQLPFKSTPLLFTKFPTADMRPNKYPGWRLR